jgi:hypothetical protein
MTEYFRIIWENIWSNRLLYSVATIILFGLFLTKFVSKKKLNQAQDIKIREKYSPLEQNVKDWAFYRYILHFFISPISNEDLLQTEIGAISELNDILNYLEEWGGLSYTDGLWQLTDKGKKTLEKYS